MLPLPCLPSDLLAGRRQIFHMREGLIGTPYYREYFHFGSYITNGYEAKKLYIWPRFLIEPLKTL